MSITAVPISIVLVRAPIAASSGNGDASCRAKWWTRTYAPSIPSASAATASSIVWFSASAAVGVREPGTGAQWPNERKPIRFMRTMIEQILAYSTSYHWGALRGRITQLAERLVDQVGQRRAIGGVG